MGSKRDDGVEMPEYAKGIKLLKPEQMPLEAQRHALELFDQLVARGVKPEKAAYTTAMVLFGRWNTAGLMQ